MKLLTLVAFSTLSTCILVPLQADPSLDELLVEIQDLKAQVTKLENRVTELEAKRLPAETFSAPEPQAPQKQSTAKQDKNWYQKFGINLDKADKEATGKWTVAENWEKLETGMTEEQLFEILGEPTRTLETIKKRVDFIHIYRGYINNQTLKVQGRVKVYKGKIVRIEKPELVVK